QSTSAGISGEAKPGDVAVIRNADTGFTREVKVKANGRYLLRNLPTGTFVVIVRHPDGSVDAPRQVTLQVGSTARVQ
ncbi:MAG: carboxypeptidase-like regulatory domain-containing protein, partial [Arenimonas sp.]